MWPRIYNALWYPALPFALIAAGGRDPQNRRERLGDGIAFDRSERARSRVWVHAASVGEIEAMRPVILELRRAVPALDFVTTTMTQAGRVAARERLPGACQLAPLDHAAAVHTFLARVRPILVLIAETELWPNFFLLSTQAGAKLAIVNGRLSERSMESYRLVRPLIARALASANLILVQTPADAERFRQLGAPLERIAVTGNTKFELYDSAPPLRPALTEFASGHPIVIAGSTGPGEEMTVLRAYGQLAARFPGVALVLAPRHLRRLGEVEQELHNAGAVYLRASELIANGRDLAGRPGVLLLDTMGELRSLYRRAAIAFVGGSLSSGRGGQSLAEPASASVPVLFGPHYENHRQVGDALVAAGAARVVRDAGEIEQACARWLADEAARTAAGACARQVIEGLAGGAAQTISHLRALLQNT